MNYLSVPSLQFMASVRVAVVLWSQPDIQKIVSKFDFISLYHVVVHMRWMRVKKKVEAKVQNIPLPNLLQEMLLNAICVIALAISIYGSQNMDFNKFSMKELHWTPHGCVDKIKSLQEFIKNKRNPRSVCLRIACRHCLEANFTDLVELQMSKFASVLYAGYDTELETDYEKKLFLYWMNRVRMNMRSSIASEDEEFHLFLFSVQVGNETACRYFWQKVRSDVDHNILVEMAVLIGRCPDVFSISYLPSEPYSDVFFFLLGEMNDEQKREVFHKEPVGTLGHFLDWPYQKYFIQTINQLWDYLTVDSCITVLKNILKKLERGYRHYDFSALFEECVQEMPSSYLSSIVRRCAEDGLLMFELFPGKDKELVSCIISHATAKQWDKIFFSEDIAFYCRDLACRSKWDSLNHFIVKCMNSESVLEKRSIYKRKVKSFFMRIMHGSKKRRLLRRMYGIVDKL